MIETDPFTLRFISGSGTFTLPGGGTIVIGGGTGYPIGPIYQPPIYGAPGTFQSQQWIWLALAGLAVVVLILVK